jgi:hypothetical protein
VKLHQLFLPPSFTMIRFMREQASSSS